MPPTPPAIDPAAYARRWKTLAVLSLSLLIIGLDNTILNVALPSLQDAFDASSSTLQWMVDAYMLVFAGVLLTAGTLGDRFGRKKALQAGLALFGGASLLVLVVQTSGQLIAVRAVMGLGGALIMPATLSIITNVFPREERAKAIGIWSGMASIGIGLGPFFGGLLLEYFDWSSVFLLNVPVAFAAFAAGFWLVPDSRDPEPGRFDIPGMTLSMASLLTLVYGVIEAPDRGWTDGRILGCFIAATVLAVAFAIRELRTESPMLNLSFFRNPRFSAASGGMSLAFFALFGATFAMTQFLQDAKGYSALQAGAAMIPLAGGLIVGAVTSVKVTERAGSKVVVAGGLAALAALLAASITWTADMPYLPLGVWFFALAMALGWIAGPATASVMGAVPEEKAGVASAMNDVTRQVAGALGTAVIGSLITSGYASRVNDAVTGLPESAQVAAKDSIGQANAVAAQLPTSDAAHLMSSAANAFTDAMGAGFLIAAGCAVVAVIGVVRWLPARDLPRTAEVVPFPDARRDEREAA